MGTTVHIKIPLLRETVRADTQTDSQSAASTSLKRKPSLIVVDDNALILTLVAKILQQDFAVTTCLDARDALRQVDAGQKFDLVVSDIMMPNMSGKVFFSEMCRRGAYEDRFLFITAGSVTEDDLDFEQRMSDKGRVIHKPFQAAKFRDAAKELLLH